MQEMGERPHVGVLAGLDVLHREEFSVYFPRLLFSFTLSFHGAMRIFSHHLKVHTVP